MKIKLNLKYEIEWRYILALASIPHPGSFLKAPMPLPKGEGRVNLIFLFPLLVGESAQSASDCGSSPGPDMFFVPTASEFGLNSVMIDNQDKALKFYTQVLGFVKKQDFPVGEFKWLTVVSSEDPGGTELALEPNENSATKTFQNALFEQGIPLTAFQVDDVQKDYERMKSWVSSLSRSQQKWDR